VNTNSYKNSISSKRRHIKRLVSCRCWRANFGTYVYSNCHDS